MSQVIREATDEDASVLARLIGDSFSDVAERFNLTSKNAPTHPSNCAPSWIRSDFEKGVRYFILENEGEPCGCVAMERAGSDHCYLERLSVLPEHRRKGFGRDLVEHVLSEARRMGIHRVEIAIIAEHGELREWYEKQGFAVTGHRRLNNLPFEVTFMARGV